MTHRTFLVFAAVVATLACSNRAANKPDSADVRSALAATSGVTHASPASDRSFRVVPLGTMTGDVEILSGDPDSAGKPFVMRIHELPGTIVPPHTHPVDENVTVVQGTWYFGSGEKFDSSALRELKLGSYAFMPAGTSMFASSPSGAVVQVHGIGPFHIHWRDSLRVLGDSAAVKTFTFRKGDEVVTPHGNGRIRQGYASGTLVQYEIESANGDVFMATQRDVRRP
jgi:quercetin dioxygenase-like cupin family protein